MQEGCTEISLRLRKKFTGIGLDVRGGMCYLCIVNFNTDLNEVMFDGNNLIEIKKKNLRELVWMLVGVCVIFV